MKNFVAIDVETANQNASSICAIGAVKVKDGVIVDSRYTLVCPEPNFYSYFCTRVHGLTDNDTWNAPSFGTVWKDWAEWMEGLPAVAHNAPFDSRCIREACRIYGVDEPEEWLDTLAEAKRLIPRAMCPSKSLDNLCEFFGIPLEHHHNALDDALACAKLGIILL